MLSYSEQDILAANVNPATGLATDYLNLFNEAIMLFEMGLDMPDMAEELAEWHPRGYVEHFEKSGFEMKDVVIAAYAHAPADIRGDFDSACARALTMFNTSIHVLLTTNPEDPAVHADLSDHLRNMKALVVEMDSHIHGRSPAQKSLQSEVDALF